jgi:arylsulfatase
MSERTGVSIERLTHLAWSLSLALLAAFAAAGVARAADKPNILFIMGDDIGWMQPSIYPAA